MAPDKPSLSTAEIHKFAAILARLQSPYDGEIINAANAATRFLTSHGLTCRDLLVPMLPRPDAPPRFSVLDDWPSRWRAAVHLCQSAAATPFSPWERQFLATIARYRHQPSSVQLDILASITARQLAGEGGA